MSPIFGRIVIKLTGPAAKRLATGLAVGAASVGVGAGGAIYKNPEAFFECVKETIKTIDPQINAKKTTPGSLVVHLEAETKEAYDKLLKSYVNGELLAIINTAVQQYAEKYDDPQPVYDEIKIIYPRAAEPVETYDSQSPTEVLSYSIKDKGILQSPERNIPFDSENLIETSTNDHQNPPDTNDNSTVTNIQARNVHLGDKITREQHIEHFQQNVTIHQHYESQTQPPSCDAHKEQRKCNEENSKINEKIDKMDEKIDKMDEKIDKLVVGNKKYFLDTECPATVKQVDEGFKQMEGMLAKFSDQCLKMMHGRNVDGNSGRSTQSDTVVEQPSMTQEKHRASTGTDGKVSDSFIHGKIIYENDVKQTKIYLARKENENQIRCLKTIGKSMLNGKPEDEVFSKLKDSNVVHFYQSYYTTIEDIPVLAIVMELCYLSVEDYICNSEGWFEKNREIMEAMDKNREMDCKETHSNIKQLLPITLLEILKQSTNGIRYLHNHDAQICHRDIKPANFMVTCDGSKTLVKVCDFGLSRKLLSLDGESSKQVETAPYGTDAYIPPESLEPNPDNKVIYKKSSDIFSFGNMFYFVLAEEKTPEGKIKRGHPFCGVRHHISKLTYKESPQLIFEAFDDSLSKEQKITARELIRQMLEFDQKNRCTIEDVYKHPVFWKASKKRRFLVDSQKYIEKRWTKVTEGPKGAEINFRRCKDDDFHERLNHFDKRLLSDCDQGNNQEKPKFQISLEILPQSVREVTGKYKVKSCRNVEEFLTVMRNKASHGNLSTDEQKKLFGDKEGDEKWEIFLNRFLEGREHLLVHLYQVFKDVEELSEYY